MIKLALICAALCASAVVLATELRAEQRYGAAKPAAAFPASLNTAASLQELLEAESRFGIFLAALKKSGVWARIGGEEPVTLFLPSDAALRASGAAPLLEGVLLTDVNSKRLRDTVELHIHFGRSLAPDDLLDRQVVTGSGTCIQMSRVGHGIRVGGAAAVVEHIAVRGGSLFVIDRLLLRSWTGEDRCRAS